MTDTMKSETRLATLLSRASQVSITLQNISENLGDKVTQIGAPVSPEGLPDVPDMGPSSLDALEHHIDSIDRSAVRLESELKRLCDIV